MWTFESMVGQPSSWLDATGPRADVVLSTRVRLARNLAGHPFPSRAGAADLAAVEDKVVGSASKSNYLTNALVVRMEEAGAPVRQLLVERHIASPSFGAQPEGRAVIIGEREVVSAMVNEEDHLRLQSISSGLQPTDAWRLVSRIDAEVERNLQYAFSKSWGYLTSCPTNVGTGVRVSVLVHLVGLARRGEVAQVLGGISKLGLSVRGFYGERSAALGGFFQVSNQTTLGQSEEDIAYTVERVGSRIVELELRARAELVGRAGRQIEDEVWRAYGILTSARVMSSEEVMSLCSSLRLGVAQGIIDDVGLGTLNRLLVVTQPGHLKYFHGEDPSNEERNRMRADLVRRELRACDRAQ
jgi:protein arginine kinase